MAKKRILSILLCFIVAVPLIALPAFASSGASGTAVYSPIPWSTIGFGTDYRLQMEYVGSSTRTGSQILSSTFNGVGGQILNPPSAVGGTIDVEVYTTGYGAFQLVARNFVLDVEAFDMFEVAVGNEDWNYDWSFRSQFSVIELRNNKWQNVVKIAKGGASNESGFTNIAPLIVRDFGRETSSRYVYVDYILLTVVSRGDVNDGFFNIRTNSVGSIPYAGSWINQYNMTYETVVTVDPAHPQDVSFVDWLVVGVGGFLKFELWDGFTLNMLIEFVVVIGLVLWFITLLI